jgi:hypothetical protein
VKDNGFLTPYSPQVRAKQKVKLIQAAQEGITWSASYKRQP